MKILPLCHVSNKDEKRPCKEQASILIDGLKKFWMCIRTLSFLETCFERDNMWYIQQRWQEQEITRILKQRKVWLCVVDDVL